MKIGFIGLGNMGGPMAANLAAAGHDVTGFDVAPAQVEGVSMVPTAQDAASGRDVVITMLPDGAICAKWPPRLSRRWLPVAGLSIVLPSMLIRRAPLLRMPMQPGCCRSMRPFLAVLAGQLPAR